MPTLPPIPQDTWDQHVETTSQERFASDLASIDQAQAAQQQAEAHRVANDARDEADAQQRASAQIEAIGIAQSRNQEEVDAQRQAAAQIDAIRAPEMPQQQAMSPTGTSMSPNATSAGPTDVGGTDWRAYAAQAAQRAGIDPALFQRQIQQESGFDPNARSGAGAQGIAQIVPSAHPGVNPLDPRASLDYAANWMRQLTDRYGGDARKALAAYNAGPGAVDTYGGVPPFEETQRYVRTIYDEGGQASPLEAPTTPGAQSSQYGSARAPSAPNERDAIRQRAEGYLGTPYLWGGADKQGIDCSAFISRAWGVPRQTTDTLARVANPIAKDDLQPGDALNLTTQQDPRGYGHVRMFDGWADPDHTTMYVYESSTATGGVARRVIPYDQAYQPMRLGTLTGEPPARTQARMHVDAPPIEAEQAQPGRPTTTPIVPEGDRPPSEFEAPSQFEGDRYLGRRPDQPITMGDVGEPTIAAGLPRTPLEALDAGATAIEGQIRRTANERAADDAVATDYFRRVIRHEPTTPEEDARFADNPDYLALTGEPLAAVNQAGRAALGLERAAATRQPGMSLYEVPPDRTNFAAYMQHQKDLTAGQSRGPTRRSPMGLRAYEAHLREQAARDLEPAGPPIGRAVDPQVGRDAGDWESLLRSMDEAEPAGTFGVLGDLPRPGVPAAREIPPELGPVVEQGRLGPRPTPPVPSEIPPELGPVVEQARLGGPQTPPSALPPGGTAGRQRALFPLGEDPTSAPTSSRLFSRSWNRIRNVVESQGEAGQQLGQGLRDWRDGAERLTGSWVSAMPTVRGLDRAQFGDFVRAAEGEAAPANPTVAKAVAEWEGVRQDVYDRAKAAGLEIGYRDDYFPHMFEPGTFKGKGFADAVTHLVTTGQAASREEAAADLRRVLAWRNRRYGNLEAERAIDVPFYRRDKGVLFGQGGYLEGAANRISQAATFGQKDAGAMALIDKIDQTHGTGDAVRGLFDAAVGARRDDPAAAAISRGLRRVNTVSSLGLSAITNAGQTVNTATVAGFGPTARAAWRYLRSPDAREDVVRAGVNLENVVADLREGAGAGGAANKVLNAITAPGFGLVERFNRGVAYHAGGDVAESLLKRADAGDTAAAAELGRLGLNPKALLERGYLTEADRITAGRRLVERSQFKVDPQDLPIWATTPAGKVVFQFKNFAYNQSAFMGREVIQPALRGDPRPLTRFLIAGLLAGAATTEVKNKLQGRESEQDPVKRVLQYYNAVGGLGLVGDVARIATPLVNINADRLPEERIASQAMSTLLGPTVGTAAELVTAGAHARQPFTTTEGEAGRYVPLERAALRRIPVVGTTLQNLLVPYTAANQAPAPAGPARSRSGGRTSRDSGRSGGR